MSAIRHSIDWPLPPTPKQQLAVWTAPSTGRCGQMCALYEAKAQGGRGAWVAFGRLCSDAVRAYDGDDKTWAYVQWRQAANPIDYQAAKARFEIGHVQGSYGALDEELFRRLALAMVRGDPTGRRVLERWQQERAFPSVKLLELHQLVAARREEGKP